MSLRSSTDQRGFTLLECVVATLMFSLLIIGFMHLNAGHERLVADIESWAAGEPTWYADRSDDDIERVLGVSATLVASDPGAPPGPPAPDAYSVTITSADFELNPIQATAVVLMVEN